MTRTSGDLFINARLIHGYDYERQAWVLDGRYVPCGHSQPCDCYGRKHAGEETRQAVKPISEVMQ